MDTPDTPAAELGATRRDRSVARVIDPARQRAEQRVQRFLDAALSLLLDERSDFTLQEVVDQAGLSLRSFYQHFGGKHELLLAVLEDQIRQSEQTLRAHLQGIEDPVEQLHRLVVEYYVLASGRTNSDDGGRGAPDLSRFAQSLVLEHPTEVTGAFEPIHVLFEEVLDAAAAAGVVRASDRPRRRAAFLLQTVNFNAYVMTSIEAAGHHRNDSRDAAEELWDLLLNGLVQR